MKLLLCQKYIYKKQKTNKKNITEAVFAIFDWDQLWPHASHWLIHLVTVNYNSNYISAAPLLYN